MSNASPKPKRNKPKIRNKTETGEGLIVKVFDELQNKVGIAFIFKMFKFTITRFDKLGTYLQHIYCLAETKNLEIQIYAVLGTFLRHNCAEVKVSIKPAYLQVQLRAIRLLQLHQSTVL